MRVLGVVLGVVLLSAWTAVGDTGRPGTDRSAADEGRTSTAWLVMSRSPQVSDAEADADLVARADAQARWVEAMAGCLHEQGWPGVEAGPQGDLDVTGVPADRHEAFQDDRAACERVAGPQPGAQPLSEADRGAVYRARLETRACLEEQGYEVAAPPPQDEFVATYYRGGGPWDPRADLPATATGDECVQP